MARKFDDFLQRQSQQQTVTTVQHYGWQSIWHWLVGGVYRDNQLLREQNSRLSLTIIEREQVIMNLRKELNSALLDNIPPGIVRAEKSYIERLVTEHGVMKREQDNVVEWIGTNQPNIFKSQRYTGLSLSQMVIHMLGGKLPENKEQ